MKKGIIISGTVLLLAAGAVRGTDDLVQNQGFPGPYRANELSLEAFGGATLGEHTINHLSGDRVLRNGRLGAGAGLNYFITRYVGIEGEAFTENTAHNFVDSVSGSLVLRLPLGQSGLAPYAFGGGGRQFDPLYEWFGHAGAGLEYRFTPHIGLFADARYVLTQRTRDYGLGRFGLRFIF